MIDQPESNLKNSPRNLNQQLINFDNLMNNKQQLKMHHIEDALASVLDDMKQLDFSTSSPVPNASNTKSNAIKVNSTPNALGVTNKAISNIVSSLSSSQGPSSSSSSSTSSTSSNNGVSKNNSTQLNNKSNDFTDENLSNSSDDELRAKQERNVSALSGDSSHLQSASNISFSGKTSKTSPAAVIIGNFKICN